MMMGDVILRAIASEKGDVYLPYAFEGKWTFEEMETVKTVLDIHCPEKVDAMFNNWRLWKWDRFSATRATWEQGALGADTAEGLAECLEEYYA